MELDARTLNVPDFDGDVCIVGAGPAGLTLARALAARGRSVVVIESGGRTADSTAQALSEGTTTGDGYAGPGVTRHRQAGGTAQVWNTCFEGQIGAKYVPLDAVDLERRDWWPLSGWPFDRAELDPYYERAQALCSLGPGCYDAETWATAARPALALASGPLTSAVYQFGPARCVTDDLLEHARRAPNVLLCLNATVVDLVPARGACEIDHIRTTSPTGRELRVHATRFVLATGGIENARLLLLAQERHDLLADTPMLGRCFMEHPRDVSARLVPADPRLFDRCGLYDLHRVPAGVVMGRVTFTEEARRARQLPAMSITLLPLPRPFGWPPAETLRRRLLGPRRRHTTGWPGLPARRFSAFELLINLEQAPDLDNRVTLGAGRDRFDLPRAAVHWRWRERDEHERARIHTIVAEECARLGLGRVEVTSGLAPDPNAHHHVGTTRMHADPSQGVVDAHGRVHGLTNLFVTGSSVFPTGGFANPTLTIVALALRLAEHLDKQL